jgi:hypothetical protein
MRLNKCRRCVQFTMYSSRAPRILWLPVKLVRLVMKMSMSGRICQMFSDDRDQATVIEIRNSVILCAGVRRFSVKWDSDRNRRSLPTCILFTPFLIRCVSSQLLVNAVPFGFLYIGWSEIRITDDVHQLFEACL